MTIVSRECTQYCLRSIVTLLNGDINKFNEYAEKAVKINENLDEKNNWMNCIYKHKGVRTKAKMNIKTREIIDLNGSILREGISYAKQTI